MCVLVSKIEQTVVHTRETQWVEKLYEGAYVLGAIFILRKGLGVGGWSRKWQISLTLCSDNAVGGWVVHKSLKTPLRIIKMAP